LLGRSVHFVCPECCRTFDTWKALEGREFRRIELSTRRSPLLGRLVAPREEISIGTDGGVLGQVAYEPRWKMVCHRLCRDHQPPLVIDVRISLLVEAFMDAVAKNHDVVVIWPDGQYVTRAGPLPVKGPDAYRLPRSALLGRQRPDGDYPH
jgi:hypothetical protein